MSKNNPLAMGILAMHEQSLDMDQSIDNLLMTCALPARKLGQTQFSQWMLSEVRGYGPDDELPACRANLNVQLLAWMPGSHWMQAPVTDELEHELANFDIRDRISDIEAQFEANKGKGGMRLDIEEEEQVELRKRANLDTRLALAMPSENFARIVATSRIMIQTWSQDLMNAGVVSCQDANDETLALAKQLDELFPEMARRIEDQVDAMVAEIDQRDGFLKRIFG